MRRFLPLLAAAALLAAPLAAIAQAPPAPAPPPSMPEPPPGKPHPPSATASYDAAQDAREAAAWANLSEDARTGALATAGASGLFGPLAMENETVNTEGRFVKFDFNPLSGKVNRYTVKGLPTFFSLQVRDFTADNLSWSLHGPTFRMAGDNVTIAVHDDVEGLLTVKGANLTADLDMGPGVSAFVDTSQRLARLWTPSSQGLLCVVGDGQLSVSNARVTAHAADGGLLFFAEPRGVFLGTRELGTAASSTDLSAIVEAVDAGGQPLEMVDPWGLQAHVGSTTNGSLALRTDDTGPLGGLLVVRTDTATVPVQAVDDVDVRLDGAVVPHARTSEEVGMAALGGPPKAWVTVEPAGAIQVYLGIAPTGQHAIAIAHAPAPPPAPAPSPAPNATGPGKPTPGLELGTLLAAAGFVALAHRRRRVH
jgi:hypothetical protein